MKPPGPSTVADEPSCGIAGLGLRIVGVWEQQGIAEHLRAICPKELQRQIAAR